MFLVPHASKLTSRVVGKSLNKKSDVSVRFRSYRATKIASPLSAVKVISEQSASKCEKSLFSFGSNLNRFPDFVRSYSITRTLRSKSGMEDDLASMHPEVLADLKVKEGKYARALEILREPLVKLQSMKELSEKEKERLHHMLGIRCMALLGMGEGQEATKVADEQIALLPGLPSGYSNKGVILESQGDYLGAMELQNKAIKVNQNYLLGYYRLALAAGQIGDYKTALDSLEHLLSFEPANYDAMMLKASVKLEMGEMEEGRDLMLAALKTDGNRPEAYAELGNLFYAMGAYERATTFIKEALKRDPRHVDALIYMGNVLAMTDHANEAITAFDSALQINQFSAKALLSKAAVLGRLKKYDDAIRAVDQVITRNSNISSAYHLKGEALEQMNKIDEAIQSFQHAIDIDPKQTRAYLSLFKTLRNSGKHDQLIDATGRAVQEIPDFTEAYYYQGMTHALYRRFSEAIAAFEKALVLNPQHAPSKASLVTALANDSQTEKALQVLQNDTVLNRDGLTYNIAIAKLFNTLDNDEEALKFLEKAIAADPSHAACYVLKAEIFAGQNKYDEAHVAYDKAIQFSRTPGRCYLAKGRLYLDKAEFELALDCFDTAIESDQLLRSLAIQGQIACYVALGRTSDAEKARLTLKNMSINNPLNSEDITADIQFKAIRDQQGETLEPKE